MNINNELLKGNSLEQYKMDEESKKDINKVIVFTVMLWVAVLIFGMI